MDRLSFPICYDFSNFVVKFSAREKAGNFKFFFSSDETQVSLSGSNKPLKEENLSTDEHESLWNSNPSKDSKSSIFRSNFEAPKDSFI